MSITMKVGSEITLPFGDSSDASSNNSAVAISAHGSGGIILRATQPGTALVTYQFFPDLSATLRVIVVA